MLGIVSQHPGVGAGGTFTGEGLPHLAIENESPPSPADKVRETGRVPTLQQVSGNKRKNKN
jgi:hypothetical protein